LGGGYAFLHNSHVRIDFVSTRLGARGRNLVDIAGIVVVLIPFCIFVINLSWGFFTAAWHSGEMSGNAGGLVRWPAYLLIPAGFSLLLLQGLAELVKRILFLTGKGPDCIAEDNAQDTPIHVPAEALSTAQEGAR
jgi:TRAP-type mannitol/chloroaromatic compound transport system permease small subunit